MSTLEQAARQALDALEQAKRNTTESIAALRSALEQPQPTVPGMAVQALAGEIISALQADEDDGGYDLTSGLFGPTFSALVRRWAAAEMTALEQLQEGVCRRCNAYSTLVKSLEQQLTHHRKQADKYQEAVKTLHSEREANAALTEELESLRSALEQPQQEPVAWGCVDEDDGTLCGIFEYEQPPHYVVPLYTAPQPTIPPGYKLVPVEPTPEMLEMGRWLEYPESESRMQPVRMEDVRGVWKAMLAASPEAPQLKRELCRKAAHGITGEK